MNFDGLLPLLNRKRCTFFRENLLTMTPIVLLIFLLFPSFILGEERRLEEFPACVHRKYVSSLCLIIGFVANICICTFVCICTLWLYLYFVVVFVLCVCICTFVSICTLVCICTLCLYLFKRKISTASLCMPSVVSIASVYLSGEKLLLLDGVECIYIQWKTLLKHLVRTGWPIFA